MIKNFISHVSKSISGKYFFQDLVEDIELFIRRDIYREKFTGVIDLFDLF